METTSTSASAPVPAPADIAAGKRLFMLMRMEWGLALLMTVLFAFALYFNSAAGVDGLHDSNSVVSLSVAAAIAFMASFFVFPMLIRRATKALVFPLTNAQVLRVSFAPYSLRLVFCELIAVVGFVGAHSYGLYFYLPFWAWAVLGLAIAAPAESKFMTAVYDSRLGRADSNG